MWSRQQSNGRCMQGMRGDWMAGGHGSTSRRSRTNMGMRGDGLSGGRGLGRSRKERKAWGRVVTTSATKQIARSQANGPEEEGAARRDGRAVGARTTGMASRAAAPRAAWWSRHSLRQVDAWANSVIRLSRGRQGHGRGMPKSESYASAIQRASPRPSYSARACMRWSVPLAAPSSMRSLSDRNVTFVGSSGRSNHIM